MGKAGGFNEQLEETKKRYTYFVPRDYAWNKMEITYPTAHKKLFMHEFAYHVSKLVHLFENKKLRDIFLNKKNIKNQLLLYSKLKFY